MTGSCSATSGALAGLGLVLLMTGAVVTRFRRYGRAPVLEDPTCLAPAACVVWVRFGPESFAT
jgi:hypothetical protein